MDPVQVDAPLILVMIPDQELRRTLQDALRLEGYAVRSAGSLEDAEAQTDELAFALVLADLYISGTPYTLASGQVLRRRVAPSPMGLLYALPLKPGR